MVGSPNPRKVFVVHGRNRVARDGIFAFLRSLGLTPIEWETAVGLTGEGSPYIGTILDVAFQEAQAVVVLMTPDEITYLRPEYADDDDPETKPDAQARPNVLFEAGMGMGRDARRTVLVELGRVRPFTDVVGRHVVRLDNSPAKRKSLAQRLENAGCTVDLSGNDWLTSGDLTPPSPPGEGMPLGRKLPKAKVSGGIRLDLTYRDRGRGSGRLQIINRGSETAYDIDIKVPPEAGNFSLLTTELPLSKLPSGKSASLLASRHMGPGKEHFDVRVTAKTAEGILYEEDVFLSLAG